MKYGIAKKIDRGTQVVAAEPSFMDKFHAGRRQLSVNRKSSQLLAMKYAIGGIFFLGAWVWNEFAPGHLYARTTAESRCNASREICNWPKLFHVLRIRALGWWAARERRSQDVSQARSEGP
jgi:hypothetical protein